MIQKNHRSFLSTSVFAALAVFSLLLLLPLNGAADFEQGRKLANKGDFQGAIREWLPLAENGNADAQFNLGRMYARGDGVRRNFLEAHGWFLKAAKQGHRGAAEKLAIMYNRGDGVEKNLTEAKRWEAVASGKALAVESDKAEVEKTEEAEKELQEAPPEVTRKTEVKKPAEPSFSDEDAAAGDSANGFAINDTAKDEKTPDQVQAASQESEESADAQKLADSEQAEALEQKENLENGEPEKGISEPAENSSKSSDSGNPGSMFTLLRSFMPSAPLTQAGQSTCPTVYAKNFNLKRVEFLNGSWSFSYYKDDRNKELIQIIQPGESGNQIGDLTYQVKWDSCR